MRMNGMKRKELYHGTLKEDSYMWWKDQRSCVNERERNEDNIVLHARGVQIEGCNFGVCVWLLCELSFEIGTKDRFWKYGI